MTLRWIWKQNKKQGGKVMALSLLGVINSVLGVLFALMLKAVVDAAVAGDKTAFAKWVLTAALAVAGMVVIHFLLCYLEELARACTENHLRQYMLDVILTRDYGRITAYHSGELMNRLFSDITLVTDSFVSLIPCMVSMAVRLICIIAVLLMLDWRFSLIFLLGGGCVIAGSLILRHRMKAYHARMQESSGRLRSFLQETLESIIVIRSFAARERIEAQSDRGMEDYKRLRMKKNRFSNIVQTGYGMLMNIGYLLGIIWCGYGIIQHTMTYGTLLAVQQLIGQLQLPVRNISAIVPQYYSMLASAERLMELCDMERDSFSAGSPAQTMDFLAIAGNNVTMSYAKGQEAVLKDASFYIRKGEFVAVTGTSGIGKSTLIKLLLGLYPVQQGTLVLENAAGKLPLSEVPGALFAYVPQGNLLMSGTIRQTITMFQEQCDEVMLERACRLACADTFINALPEGFETRLGEKGHGLSEGQMQRIAIARALYHDFPVLLLDEATSALDEATELSVLKNLRQMTDKTVLIITHRRVALAYCDRQITLRDKKIVEVT